MRADLTELVLIVDRSGSMENMRDETIVMVNTVVAEQLANGQELLDLTLAVFDTHVDVITNGMRATGAVVLTTENYKPNGYTALHDAVAEVITVVGRRLAARAEEDRPSAVVVAIITDGQENASTHHTLSDVRRIIERQKELYNWQFLFLGANQDAWATGQSMGLQVDDAKPWIATKQGMADLGADLMKEINVRKKRARN
jgi:Mg-chelatase subunit ChlD